MDHKKSKEKNGEGFRLIQVSSLKYIFLWNRATIMRFHYVRYCTLLEVRTNDGIKEMGMHN
jgi:hypothetical protein